jgi:hypothetical protein
MVHEMLYESTSRPNFWARENTDSPTFSGDVHEKPHVHALFGHTCKKHTPIFSGDVQKAHTHIFWTRAKSTLPHFLDTCKKHSPTFSGDVQKAHTLIFWRREKQIHKWKDISFFCLFLLRSKTRVIIILDGKQT